MEIIFTKNDEKEYEATVYDGPNQTDYPGRCFYVQGTIKDQGILYRFLGLYCKDGLNGQYWEDLEILQDGEEIDHDTAGWYADKLGDELL